jgi:hypothetical protein
MSRLEELIFRIIMAFISVVITVSVVYFLYHITTQRQGNRLEHINQLEQDNQELLNENDMLKTKLYIDRIPLLKSEATEIRIDNKYKKVGYLDTVYILERIK